jgi:hypothetical protein
MTVEPDVVQAKVDKTKKICATRMIRGRDFLIAGRTYDS